jgi:2,4-diketo-3-deoxy-L-fuconate hydrolase
VFRLINIAGRAALDVEGRWFDLAQVSGDEGLSNPMVAIARSAELHGLATHCTSQHAGGNVTDIVLHCPVPRPRQVFAIGLNYADHAAESGMAMPPAPLTFTKFPSCLNTATGPIALSGQTVDWEVELVVVIGTEETNVPVDGAWAAVAGLTLGQDISDRTVQMSGQPPQFSLGKSFTAFGPTGPALVSTDSFADLDDIGLWCDVGDERMQDGRTDDLIFAVPTLVAYLSSICTLFPGDLIFTGTPAGVGMGRGRFLAEGEVLTSGAEVIGELSNRCVAGSGPLVP